MNIKNNIVKPMLITFIVMLFLSVTTYTIMHFFFPLSISRWFYSMGANDLAVSYMEKAYNKDKQYSQLYTLVNLSIKTGKYDKVEKYYEIFSNDDRYSDFVLRVDTSNASKDVNNLVKSSIYSEDNYLKNRYILALVKQNKTEKAFNYASANSSAEVSVDNLGIYLYTYIFTQECEFDNMDNLASTCTQLKNYFYLNIEIFNQLASSTITSDVSIKGLVLGNRINEISKNLKAINNVNNSLLNMTNETINSEVLAVSKKMIVFA